MIHPYANPAVWQQIKRLSGRSMEVKSGKDRRMVQVHDQICLLAFLDE